jgi:uncharacterized protein
VRIRSLLAYLTLAYGWTWLTVLPLVLQKRGLINLGLPDAWEAVGAFGPLLAALVVLRAPGRMAEFRARVWGSPARGWVAMAVLSPVLFLLLALAAAGTWPDWQRLGVSELATLPGLIDLLLVAGLLQGLGEEPGWRGYLLPALRQRFGPLAATLVLFPLWLFWHLPFFLARPEFGIAQFAGFSLGILSAAIWLTFLWERTHSIGLAVLWHALLNITRGVALALSTGYFLGFGLVVTAGALGIAGWWLLRPTPCGALPAGGR